MASSDKSPVDGFYAAYFTGASGTSIGMFVFKDGVVVGADAGGGRYDGEFSVAPDEKSIEAKIRFSLPIGNQSITGATATAEPISIEVPLRLPVEFNRNDVHRIETPIGPINAKFDKIRGV
jgi:hypothetical protein